MALVSGGQDSAAAAAVAVEKGVDLLVYLDTGTGLEANREYVEELAWWLDCQVWTLRTPEAYEQAVRESGFPSPGDHAIMYRKLKERQLERLATLVGGRGHGAELFFWTGVRRAESRNRMARVSEVQDHSRWTWVAPLADWTKDQVRAKIDDEGLPTNPLWSALGRSGDCYCGAYASRSELLDLEAAGFEEHAAWIRELEDELQSEALAPTNRSLWGWAKMDEKKLRAHRAKMDEEQAILCSSCGVRPREES